MKALFSSCGHYLRLGRSLKAKPLGRALRGLDPAPESELGAAKRKTTERTTSQLWRKTARTTRPGSRKEPTVRWGSKLAQLRYERMQHWVSDYYDIDRHG